MRDIHPLQLRLIRNIVDLHGAVAHSQHLGTFARIIQKAVVHINAALGLVFKPCRVFKTVCAEVGHALGNFDVSQFRKVIMEVNATAVSEEEYLSDHAYLYKRKSNKLQSIA